MTDQDVERYYAAHYPKAQPPLASVRQKIEDQIAGERINQAFYAWLEQQRNQAAPEFLEGVFE